jgi:hypothetical protein
MYRGEIPKEQSLRYGSGLAVLDLRDLQAATFRAHGNA